MTLIFKRACVTGVATAFLLFGCTEDSVDDRTVRDVVYSGYYNEISGTLSDGSTVSGVAWFTKTPVGGDFCLQTQDTVCSGRYSASLSRRISGKFVCANGLTGSYKTERIPKGDFVVPLNATGVLSDGRSANVVFSELLQGKGITSCFTKAGQ